MSWQSMETAPKDCRILVFNPYFGVYSSQYTVTDNWSGWPLGLTSAGLGKWYCATTHWKPLPAGPEG